MSSLRSGALPRLRLAALTGPSVVALALVAGGCSSQNSNQHAEVWPWSAEPQRVAAAVPVEPRRVELEDDGQEAQVAPPRSIRQAPDDPREPWSRNYGPPPVPRRADIPPDLPPDFRRRLVASVPE